MKSTILTLTALALSASLTLAQDADKPKGEGKKGGNPEMMFKRLDADNDSAVTLEEFKAGPMGQKNPDKAEARYKKMDADSDGKLTMEEMKAAQMKGGKGGKKKDEAAAQ